ncbi:MAG: membrane protein insertion efficiency factor YidD [Gammaproteobacteria bacterium]|nr:membrane protein insertion efficiency factor YidD [Gammaproteobacteria bacterium]MCZ6853426.1 membrane protein insertion efficiency factor YidD [Gammaproteobacteria bacterium]
MIRQLPKRILMGLVRVYQVTLSPFFGRQCRFEPTCSHYALQALEEYGALQGSWLAIKRVGRCHPFHPGGFDPVKPVRRTARQTAQEET